MTVVGGETTMWEIYQQESVSVVNIDDITESRRQELKETVVVILVCPECKLKTQWLEEFLPRKLGHD
jgi:homoserine kinase